MPKAVIFDIDGTLIDTVDLHAAAWVETFRDFGFVTAHDDVRAQIGKGGDQLMPVFLPRDVLDARGKDIERHRSDLFKRRHLSQARAFPGVRALFEHIRAQGQAVALASSGKKDEVERYQEIAGVAHLRGRHRSGRQRERQACQNGRCECGKGLHEIREAPVPRYGSPHVNPVGMEDRGALARTFEVDA